MIRSLIVAALLFATAATAQPNYAELAADAFYQRLRDPSSVRDAERTPPLPGWFGTVVVCVRMNSKNGFGGYTGIQESYVLFKRDRISIVPDPVLAATLPSGSRSSN